MSEDRQVDMKIDPARAKSLIAALQGVSERITHAAQGRTVRALLPFF
jgi:ribosomal protein L12E/L44/L45/RPP1/RPP2